MADNLDWHAVLAVLDRGGGAGPSASDVPRSDAGGRAEPGTLAEWAASHTPPPPRSQTPATGPAGLTLGPPHAQTHTHGPGADLLAQALLAQQLYGFGSAEYAAVLHHLAAGATAASAAASTSGASGASANAGPSTQAGGRNARSSPATPAPTPASPFAAPQQSAQASASDTRPQPPPNPPPPPAPPRTPRGSVGVSASASASVPGTPAEDAEDKRVRNTLASARFRAKKKAHVETVERNIRALEAQHAELEVEVTDLKKENGLLKEMVQLKYAGGSGKH